MKWKLIATVIRLVGTVYGTGAAAGTARGDAVYPVCICLPVHRAGRQRKTAENLDVSIFAVRAFFPEK